MVYIFFYYGHGLLAAALYGYLLYLERHPHGSEKRKDSYQRQTKKL